MAWVFSGCSGFLPLSSKPINNCVRDHEISIKILKLNFLLIALIICWKLGSLTTVFLHVNSKTNRKRIKAHIAFCNKGKCLNRTHSWKLGCIVEIVLLKIFLVQTCFKNSGQNISQNSKKKRTQICVAELKHYVVLFEQDSECRTFTCHRFSDCCIGTFIEVNDLSTYCTANV